MKIINFLLAAMFLWSWPAESQTLEENGESGLKLPRFVSLHSNLINARSGPGVRYPIEWVYMQKTNIQNNTFWKRNCRYITCSK